MSGWKLEPAYSDLTDDFGQRIPGQPFALQGEHRFEAAKVVGEIGVLRFKVPTRHQSASP